MYKAFLLVAAAIWGLGTVVIKSTVDEFPPAWLVGVRFTVAGIILGIVMLPRFRKALDLDHLKKGAILGAFLFQGVLAVALPVANLILPEGNLSEVARIVISNGIILYALTKTGGSSRE